MGTVSGLYEGLKTRTDAMTKDPSLYNIVNWLTLGTADMVKGAFSPDEPLSLEHWLNSLGVVSIAAGAYELAQKYAPTMIDDVAAFEPSAKSDIFNATPSRETQIVRESKYLNVEGNIDWPRYAPNDGFVEGSQHMVTLDKDTLIDRYGAPNGSFVAPAGTLYEMRSLPYFENPYAYHEYRVIEPIENVKMGEIAPAFDQPGGGIQYLLPASIKDLLEKYIEEVK